MKRTIYVVAVAIFALSCKEKEVSQSATPTQKEIGTPTQETTQTTTVLFDGSNFDAWKGYGINEMHEEWTIDGDAMMFTPSDEGGKNIITKDAYKNFILELEWKISEGGNSGIFWGVHESPEFKEAYETGPEIQVLDDARHPDAKVANGTHKAGSLYDMIKPEDGMIHPAGEWNRVKLMINHDTNIGKLYLNGKDAFTFPVHGEAWDAMVAGSKFADWKGFGKYPEGHIGLQDHGDKVWYRNIKIKEIN
ncbi:DUF1080 domain-containing protein [uncultured Dokdonia sp.]|uniref:3-keto-disaccharide hydrolase n=1 Tax=uncultured Dokdonia sp. TaxID=575653 RepID=UPI0026152420|nr:DUF1080 domain-containing protein [uncultured Dokdonia sp.]